MSASSLAENAKPVEIIRHDVEFMAIKSLKSSK
jgi:hypothetical protein